MHACPLKNNLAARFLVLVMAAIEGLVAQYPVKGGSPRTEVTQPATTGAAFFSLYAGGIFPFTVATDSSGNLYIAGTVQSNIFAATAGAVQNQYGGGTCINADPHQAQTYPCFDRSS
jgi:beta-propeller repeat-containing protein